MEKFSSISLVLQHVYQQQQLFQIKTETIIKKILEIWTSVYGKPQKFLTDNGGEFANADFLKMAEQLRIDVKTTAVESAWSNEVAERQFCDRRHVR